MKIAAIFSRDCGFCKESGSLHLCQEHLVAEHPLRPYLDYANTCCVVFLVSSGRDSVPRLPAFIVVYVSTASQDDFSTARRAIMRACEVNAGAGR